MVRAMVDDNWTNALRNLCLEVANFTCVSRDIIFPKSKRHEVLKNYAQALHKASERFLKVCEDEQIQNRD